MKKALLFITLLTGNQAMTEEIDFSASMGIETRGFIQEPLIDNDSNRISFSGFIEPEAKWRSEDRKKRFSFVGFGRYDEQDSERSHLDVRELYWSFNSGDWTTLIGINKVFWGVIESVHLVDVINQTDLVEDFDQEAKLGQPMIHFSNQKDWGKLDFYVLPYFRERTFASTDGRFNFDLNVADDAIYESSNKKSHIDLAFRYSHYFGDIDFGFHVFDGTNREPTLIPNKGFTELVANYYQMTQLGIDMQYTNEAWLWKIESIHRSTDQDDFFAAVAGFEYTLYQINENAHDLGFLFEYQHDDRNTSSAPTIADNDVFLAARYTLNDTQDTSILAGVVVDIDNDTTFINIEAERRIGKNLSAELRLRALTNVNETDSAYAFANDDYMKLGLSWYF